MINKSSVTNITCLLIVVIGYVLEPKNLYFLNMGFFGLSGALTNWLAIHMLFEKVPGLYGSGIIPLQFEEFKIGIRQLIMTQFFNQENIDRFISDQIKSHSGTKTPNLNPIISAIDFDRLFHKLIEAVESSPLGPLLQMMGGKESLQNLKGPFIEKTREAIDEMLLSDAFQKGLEKVLSANFSGKELIDRVEYIVEQRLSELTPELVKIIIQDMIKQHLGWLVVWGGLFGGLIGLLTSFVTTNI